MDKDGMKMKGEHDFLDYFFFLIVFCAFIYLILLCHIVSLLLLVNTLLVSDAGKCVSVHLTGIQMIIFNKQIYMVFIAPK